MNGISFGRAGTSYYPSQSKVKGTTQNQTNRTTSKRLKERCLVSELAYYKSDREKHLYKDALYTICKENGQELHMNYDESSTEENPVMKVWGVDSRGKEFEELVYVNEVDPHEATTAEIKALQIHLRQQGERIPGTPPIRTLGPEYALMGYDVHEKLDFVQFMEELEKPYYILDQESLDKFEQLESIDEERLKLWFLEYSKENGLYGEEVD